jgi:hypothetical protein
VSELNKYKKTYKDEWVLVEVIKEDEKGSPTNVKLLAHCKARDEIYDVLKRMKKKYTYLFYTGKIPKKGYAVAFNEI